MSPSNIRNFSIIAHIDHGKSTLADRLLEATGAISSREKKDQFLDSMDLERERGITIKAQSVRLKYIAKNGLTYHLNLIDTPGHVDFHYEVSRSLSACEGVLLVIDAAQGIEAQTLSNAYLAINNNLEIVPVINKIDLPSADPQRVRRELEEIIGIPSDTAVLASAKTGQGVEEVLEAIVHHIPPPKDSVEDPLRALIFDSWFDNYLGVIVLIRIKDGGLKKGDRFRLMSTQREYEVTHLGYFTPHPTPVSQLMAGEVGFFAAAVKDVREMQIGDTITLAERPAKTPLPGFKKVTPMVFAGLYPTQPKQYEPLKSALEKLQLNDASFSFEPETSVALGFGFRCGFLGLLHVEIIRERLEREYDLELITTAPTVVYRVKTTKGKWLDVDNPSKFPPEQEIDEVHEPYIKAQIHLPHQYVGGIMQLCVERRGIQVKMEYPTPERVMLYYEMPFSEMMFDFYDKLKSFSQGYDSLDYDIIDWRPSNLIKLNVLLNGDPVDALSVILHKDKAPYRGREIVKKLREVIPRQMYEVALQAAIGNRVIARESVKALRKNVTAKCYGGDVTRKRKLLEKQKEGKKRMKR